MSETTQKLRKFQQDYTEIRRNNEPQQFLWQCVTKDSDFVQDAQAYSPVDRHRRPVTLPDPIEERIALLNSGEALLLGGLLRLFIVNASVNLDVVEELFEALQRRFGGDHSAKYALAYKLLFPEE